MKKRDTDAIALFIYKALQDDKKTKTEAIKHIASCLAITFARENHRFNWEAFINLTRRGEGAP